jgi:hypothetical protein
MRAFLPNSLLNRTGKFNHRTGNYFGSIRELSGSSRELMASAGISPERGRVCPWSLDLRRPTVSPGQAEVERRRRDSQAARLAWCGRGPDQANSCPALVAPVDGECKRRRVRPASVCHSLGDIGFGRVSAGLQQHAESLAAAQPVTTRPNTGRRLATRLRENGRVLLDAYRAIAVAIREERAITSAAEWLVDNFHVVEEQIREIRDDLPRGFYRQLPKLAGCLLWSAEMVRCLGKQSRGHDHFRPRHGVNCHAEVQPLIVGNPTGSRRTALDGPLSLESSPPSRYRSPPMAYPRSTIARPLHSAAPGENDVSATSPR